MISDRYIKRLGQVEGVAKAEGKGFRLPKGINHLQNKSSPVQRRVVENH